MYRMLRPALASTAALTLLALLAGCAEKPPPAPPPVAAYVPPPLPEPPTAPWCARPAEISAFSVAALKSDLMVAAVSCQSDEKYNAFVTRYRPTLVAEEKLVETYFSRNDKRRWQQERDDYITQLANAQSQRAMVLGSQFCQRTLGQFDELLALAKSEDLPGFADGKQQSVPQAMKFSECPPPPPPPAKPAARRASSTK
jgi:hypothetical protein